MERLLKGIEHFQREVFPRQRELFGQLATKQNPEFLFVTCSDSRVDPKLFTQTLPGELFVCRNAGNMVPPYGELHGGVSATIEYAVAVLNVRHIIVCGHSDCGAMKGVMHPELVDDLPAVRDWLRHGAVARRVVRDNYGGLSEREVLPALTEHNVVAQLANLRTHPSVAARLQAGTLELHAWIYHIASGQIEVYSQKARRFEPIGAAVTSEVAA